MENKYVGIRWAMMQEATPMQPNQPYSPTLKELEDFLNDFIKTNKNLLKQKQRMEEFKAMNPHIDIDKMLKKQRNDKNNKL